MKKLKVGQIGIGHNHGEKKMLAVKKFPELFEVIGYAEENDRWIEKRGELGAYKDLTRTNRTCSADNYRFAPPATLMASPVRNLASGDTRKPTTSATSSG